MTERKILFALKKIHLAFENGFVTEALIGNYHLNSTLLKFICSASEKVAVTKEKKMRALIAALALEVERDSNLKTLISKKNLKTVKVWALKMDDYFKELKYGTPENSKSLYNETQKIFGILNISAHKIFAGK